MGDRWRIIKPRVTPTRVDVSLLFQTAPDTLMGVLLRKFWHPVESRRLAKFALVLRQLRAIFAALDITRDIMSPAR